MSPHRLAAHGSKGPVTNYRKGGLLNRGGGASEVLPLQKRGTEKVLAMLKGGGHKKLWGSFDMGA